MVVAVQVLSVSSVEMAPSLMVSTEAQRLLFNVGDGTQRMCMEHHVRLAKLRHVFLTELCPDTVGGLPGMVLTVSDTGKDALQVHGPSGTKQYLHATRHFLNRPGFRLDAVDHTHPVKCYADDEVLVHAVPLRARTGLKRKLDDTTAASPRCEAHDVVSYVVETPEQRGKFLVDKALALGDARYSAAETVAMASATRAWLKSALHITSFECVPVKHAHLSYAVVFRWKDALKFVFSGDCRPSELLAERAKDAFLFIHEATFDDSMGEEAKSKAHSTTAEALEVGKAANAQHIVLTHFSQRYPKMPAIDSATTESDAMSAMDLLSLRFSDLHRQASLMDVCMQILAADESTDGATEDNL
ncbi:hypothetical protein ATCC90586_003382 [Pythium insidiosum]|nr:hypothetical protein ATCC90586_003382 [Pythium insidiosum]